MSGRVLPFEPPAHKVADVLLPWFVNGTLDDDERAFVEEHLSECARCQREVQWLRDLRTACADGEAVPGASAVFRKLGRQLDEPRKARAGRAWLRGRWTRAPAWSRWALAAQLAVILGLGSLQLATTDAPALYRTLGARSATLPPNGTLVVVFDPSTTESDFRRILRKAGARVVDGPTQTNAYVLSVADQRQDAAMKALRAEPAVVLVEQLGPSAAH